MKFEDWFEEVESYSTRSMRFWQDECGEDNKKFERMKEWLQAAFAAGQSEQQMIEDIEDYPFVRSIDSLSDDEIEECFDGSSNVELVRRLLKDNLNAQGLVYECDFGEEFATAIEGFISEDHGTKEWDEAWEVNRSWGQSIAENINEVLKG